jgi:hypothetical protein
MRYLNVVNLTLSTYGGVALTTTARQGNHPFAAQVRIPHEPKGLVRKEDDMDVMEMLEQGIPLTLLIDLLDEHGPSSQKVYREEPADAAWLAA